MYAGSLAGFVRANLRATPNQEQYTTPTSAQCRRNSRGDSRRMHTLGLTDPYVAVTEPPDDYGKLRRHLHSRYRFEPLESAGEF